MKDSHLINYRLFCIRRKFNLYSFLLKNKNMNYNEFKEYFRNIKVSPPDQEQFDKVIKKINEDLNLNKIKEEEDKTNSLNKKKKVSKPRKIRRKKNV
tara:strand:- start:1303 stop:1593 length:291 start_codon:yes stop_codon:yes gene_type:complete